MIRYLKTSKPVEAQAEIASQVRDVVADIIASVGRNGGAAVREYSQKFDKWSPADFRLSDEEVAACVASLSKQELDDITFAQAQAQAQVRRFAEVHALPRRWSLPMKPVTLKLWWPTCWGRPSTE